MRVKLTTKILKLELICKFYFLGKKNDLLEPCGKFNYENTKTKIDLNGPVFFYKNKDSLESCG